MNKKNFKAIDISIVVVNHHSTWVSFDQNDFTWNL